MAPRLPIATPVTARTVLREWGRIGVIGFGGRRRTLRCRASSASSAAAVVAVVAEAGLELVRSSVGGSRGAPGLAIRRMVYLVCGAAERSRSAGGAGRCRGGQQLAFGGGVPEHRRAGAADAQAGRADDHGGRRRGGRRPGGLFASVVAFLGAAVLLLEGVTKPWQVAVLAVAALALATRRVGVVAVLVGAALVGALVGVAGGPLPGA